MLLRTQNPKAVNANRKRPQPIEVKEEKVEEINVQEITEEIKEIKIPEVIKTIVEEKSTSDELLDEIDVDKKEPTIKKKQKKK